MCDSFARFWFLRRVYGGICFFCVHDCVCSPPVPISVCVCACATENAAQCHLSLLWCSVTPKLCRKVHDPADPSISVNLLDYDRIWTDYDTGWGKLEHVCVHWTMCIRRHTRHTRLTVQCTAYDIHTRHTRHRRHIRYTTHDTGDRHFTYDTHDTSDIYGTSDTRHTRQIQHARLTRHIRHTRNAHHTTYRLSCLLFYCELAVPVLFVSHF